MYRRGDDEQWKSKRQNQSQVLRVKLPGHTDLKGYVAIQSTSSSPVQGLPYSPTIMAELGKPGRDPRATFNAFFFASGVNNMDDLLAEMKLPGIVTNVTKFGALVDIGVHQDGLLHISQLADRFIRDPSEIVKIGQQLVVRFLEVDSKRKRISLSLRKT